MKEVTAMKKVKEVKIVQSNNSEWLRKLRESIEKGQSGK